MTDERLEQIRAVVAEDHHELWENAADYANELLSEIDRRRESIEAVKALQRYADVEESEFGLAKSVYGEWIYRDDVLDVLEGVH